MLCLLGPGGNSISCSGWGEAAREDVGLDREEGLDNELCCLTAEAGVRNGLTLLGRLPFRGGVCGIEVLEVFAEGFRANSPDGATASL